MQTASRISRRSDAYPGIYTDTQTTPLFPCSHSPSPPHKVQMFQHSFIRIQKSLYTILRTAFLTSIQLPVRYFPRDTLRPADICEIMDSYNAEKEVKKLARVAWISFVGRGTSGVGEQIGGARQGRGLQSCILAFCISFWSDCWSSRLS